MTDNLDNTETGLARGEDGDSSPKPSDALCLRSGLRVEYLDDEAIVLDQDGQSIHRLQGESVAALRLVEQGLDPATLQIHLLARSTNSPTQVCWLDREHGCSVGPFWLVAPRQRPQP